MTEHRSGRLGRVAIVPLLCALIVLSACGTRASEADKLAARGLADPRPAAQVSLPSGAAGEGGPGDATSASEGSANPVSGVETARPPGSGVGTSTAASPAGSATAARSVTAAGGMPAAGSSGSSSAPTGAARPTTGGASTVAAAPGANPVGATAPTAPSGPKPPITIGSVSTLSGPAASGELPGLEGLQIWVKWINERGGVRGHLINLVVADDNSDGARHRQLVQEFVERKGVIAFVQQGEALTGAGSVDYVTKKGVPVINSEGGNDYFYKSPMYFPLVAHGEELIKGTLFNSAEYAKAKGVKKFGVIACTEAQVCNDTARLNGNADNVRAAGMELVYTARTSLAQPDFTAECIGARNAGAEIVQIALDGNSVARVAASCARQNYRPLFSVFAAVAFDKMKDNPDLDRLTVNANAFPYFLCEGNAKDYCDALRKYGPVSLYGIGTANGWTAGKGFEQAAQNVPDGQVTSQDILKGLWSFRNETLGDLTHPLTFTEGQTAPRKTCWWPLIIESKKFNAPAGMTVRCAN